MRRWLARSGVASAGTAVLLLAGVAPPASAADFVAINGAGSTWASNLVSISSAHVRSLGLTVNYQPNGSALGERQFDLETADFAVTDTPVGILGQGTARPHTAVPAMAGSIDLMYNLKIAGKRVTDLRLSGDVAAAIFMGDITSWDDPAVSADNPGLTLPSLPIKRVVRSDFTASTLQLTGWLNSVAPARYQAYCQRIGMSPCAATTQLPDDGLPGSARQNGSVGVSGYVASPSSIGAITYVEHSYALIQRFPVAKILNSAGYYVAPTPGAVSLALLQARPTGSGTGYPESELSGVWRAADPRAYPLSSYSYLIAPTTETGSFTLAKGTTLTSFAQYLLCDGQRGGPLLGYAPLPVNLVQAGLTGLGAVPGAAGTPLTLATCAGPTFAADGTDVLNGTVPMPADCDQVGRSCTVTPDPGSSSTESLTTTVEAGTLTITVDIGDVDLGTATLDATNSRLTTLPTDMRPITVTDTRAGNPGYTITGVSDDFTSAAGNRINAANLGWQPRIVTQQPAQALIAGPLVAPAAGPEPPGGPRTEGLATPRTLASAPPGGGIGTAVIGATLVLHAPTSTPAGQYRATITITAI